MNRIVRSFCMATLIVTASSTVGSAGTPTPPAAEVRISRDVRLGQFTEAIVTVWARCQPPWLVQDLVIDVSQANATGSRAGDFAIVCDGEWRRIQLAVTTPGGGPFSSGRTTVNAFFTVIDPVTGDPAPQAQDSISVWVWDQAEVRIVNRDVRLGPAGAMIVPVRARCERPWVQQGVSVGVAQDEGFLFGSAAGDFGLVCDDAWHRIRVRVISSGARFHRGLTIISAELSVLDPIDFDPVDTGQDSATVWVKPFAA